MVIKFICPSCRKSLKIKLELAGKKIVCDCGQKILVPEAPTTYDDAESALHPNSPPSLGGNADQIF